MKRLRRFFCWHRWSPSFGFIGNLIQTCEKCGAFREVLDEA